MRPENAGVWRATSALWRCGGGGVGGLRCVDGVAGMMQAALQYAQANRVITVWAHHTEHCWLSFFILWGDVLACARGAFVQSCQFEGDVNSVWDDRAQCTDCQVMRERDMTRWKSYDLFAERFQR